MACRLPIGGCADAREKEGASLRNFFSEAVLFWCFSGQFCSEASRVGAFSVLVRFCWCGCFRVWSESVQSRFPARGTERLPFFLHPVRTSGLTTPAGARHEPSDHAGGTQGAVAKRDDALREVATPFSFFLGFLCK